MPFYLQQNLTKLILTGQIFRRVFSVTSIRCRNEDGDEKLDEREDPAARHQVEHDRVGADRPKAQKAKDLIVVSCHYFSENETSKSFNY